MPTGIDLALESRGEWTFRFRPAQSAHGRLLVLLHGWTGDENSMHVFLRVLPQEVAVLVPRAPFAGRPAGFSWREMEDGQTGVPAIEQLWEPARRLGEFLTGIGEEKGLDTRSFDLLGFSQGAAMAYTLLLLEPARIGRLAALSGFLPLGAHPHAARTGLQGVRVLITHGRQDEMVPVEMARSAASVLRQVGVEVEYCETDGGHKVSKQGMQAILAYFRS